MKDPTIDVKDAADIKRLEKNRVIVRVWTSSINPVKTGHGMGHVSIETPPRLGEPGGYISLWPTEPATPADRGKVLPHDFSPDYMTDYESEGRQKPEYIFCFYTLNAAKINEAFAVVKDTLEGWTMAPYGVNTKGAESCATLAWKMLGMGGISDLVSKAERSMMSSSGSSKGSSRSTRGFFSASSHAITSKREELQSDLREIRRGVRYAQEMTFGVLIASPDSVAQALVRAKEHELTKSPLTAHIKKYPGETDVTPQRGKVLVRIK